MPFTPAHVAAVLPLLRHRSARSHRAVPAALVVGSMAPDLLYFVPLGDRRDVSHSLLGAVTLDPLLGMLCLAAWWYLAAPAAHDLAPGPVRRRLARPWAPARPREWWPAVPALVVGVLTHLAWDAFTHADGWVVLRVPALTAEVGGQPVFKLAQYLSGVLGMAAVLLWCARRLARTAPRPEEPAALSPGRRRAAWAALLVLPVVGGLVFAAAARGAGAGPEYQAYVLVVRTISGLGLVGAVVTGWWHLEHGLRTRAA